MMKKVKWGVEEKGGESSAASDFLEEEETKNGAEEGEYTNVGVDEQDWELSV